VAGAPSPDSAAIGRSAAALLRRVEVKVGRRLDGLLQGERRGRRPGPGGEPAVTRAYAPGDDVRWIDWPLTARSREPMVRVPEIEPVLTTWALVDMSPSMAFGTHGGTKLAQAREVLAALGVVLRRRGDRLGLAVTTHGDLDLVRPPRGDRRGLINAVAAIDSIIPAGDGRTDLAHAITLVGRVARHRGMVVIISDMPFSPGLERAIGGLGRRHDVVVVEIRDRREREIPPVGVIPLRDVETGRTLLVDTSDPRFQERFSAAVDDADRRRRAMIARTGARYVVMEPGRDWLLDLARALGTARAPRRAAA
jgi:uncharacterized protein (DUF58 family)